MIKDVTHLTVAGDHGHELCNGLRECAGTVDESHFLGTGRQVDFATQHRMILIHRGQGLALGTYLAEELLVDGVEHLVDVLFGLSGNQVVGHLILQVALVCLGLYELDAKTGILWLEVMEGDHGTDRSDEVAIGDGIDLTAMTADIVGCTGHTSLAQSKDRLRQGTECLGETVHIPCLATGAVDMHQVGTDLRVALGSQQILLQLLAGETPA